MTRGRLALVAFGVVMGLLIVEGALRIVLPASLVKRMVPDPVAGYRYLPDQRFLVYSPGEFVSTQATNAHGDADVERALQKPAQTFRIAVIGDSMTEAGQVDQDVRFTALLERELNAWLARQAPGRRVEVLNFGHGGNSTAQELLRYRAYVRHFQPNLVLLVLLPVNDVRENSLELDATRSGFVETRPYFHLDATGALAQNDERFYENAVRESARDFRTRGLRGGIRWLRDQSRLVDVLVWLYQALEYRFRTGLPAADLEQFLASYQRQAVWQRAWMITKALVRTFAADVRHDGAAFHVAVVSGPLEVNQETREFVFRQLRPPLPSVRAPVYDWDLPNRLAGTMLRELSVSSTNLWPSIRAAARQGTRTNFVYDGHYTPAGHRIVAAALLPVLQEYVTVWLSGHH